MDHIWFIHSSTDGRVGGFYLLAIVNRAAVNMVHKDLCEHLFSLLWGLYLGVELLDRGVPLCFEEVPSCFPQGFCPPPAFWPTHLSRCL